MHLIPESWSHLHILASVFPSVGLVFALGLYVTAMITKNVAMTRTCLASFVILALFGVVTYFSGDGSMAALSDNPKFSEDMVDAHYGWGITALGVLMATGLVALIEFVRSLS